MLVLGSRLLRLSVSGSESGSCPGGLAQGQQRLRLCILDILWTLRFYCYAEASLVFGCCWLMTGVLSIDMGPVVGSRLLVNECNVRMFVLCVVLLLMPDFFRLGQMLGILARGIHDS